jgi:hypothetical protein
MNNNHDNLTSILENEISNLLENYINEYNANPNIYSPNNRSTRDTRENNAEDADIDREDQLFELHMRQLNLISLFTTQFYRQINLFQENIREMINLMRTTIQMQNNYYANIQRMNNQRTNRSPNLFTNRYRQRFTNTMNSRYNDRDRDHDYDLLFSYIIPPNTRTNVQSSRLTSQQIQLATQNIVYDETMNEERCPITLDNFIVGENICQIRHCRHIFKTDPLMNWFQRNVKCPVCRYDIRTYNSPSTIPSDDDNENTQPTSTPTALSNQNQPSYSRGLSSIIQNLTRELRNGNIQSTYTFEIPLYVEDSSGNITD